MKPGVVALVPDEWGGPWMPRHQILLRLSRRWPVVWMDQPRAWQEHLSRSLRRISTDSTYEVPVTDQDFYLYRAPALLGEYYRPAWLSRTVRHLRLAAAVRWLRRQGCDRLILYLWRPELGYALDSWNWDFTLYHIDDEYSFAEEERVMSAMERRVIKSVDQVIVHSPGLMQRKGGINPNTVLVPNGVDYSEFATPRPEPHDLAEIPHPRVGYVGVIKKQLDLSLLAALAEEHGNYSFVLVGPINHGEEIARDIDRLQRLPNVHFLGPRRPTELPDYIQHLDVGLLCYRVNAYTNCIYPLKLHEYLAAGIPAIGTPIRSLMEYRQQVVLAESLEQWSKALESALVPQTQEAITRRRELAKSHDWDKITERIQQLMQDQLSVDNELTLASGETSKR